jgi:hypothetical protein
MRQDPASMSDEALLAALGGGQRAPAAPQAMSDADLMRALGRPAPAAQRQAAPGRAAPQQQPAAPRRTLGDSGLTVEETFEAQRGQGYSDDEIAAYIAETFGGKPEDYFAAGPNDVIITQADVLPRGGAATAPVEQLPLEKGNLLQQAGAGLLENPVVGPVLSGTAGLARGLWRVAGGAYGLAGRAVGMVPGAEGVSNTMVQGSDAFQNAMDLQNAPYREAHTLANQTGQVGGEVAATAPLGMGLGRVIQAGGRGLANVAPRAGQIVERVGQATTAGGFAPSAARSPAVGASPGLGSRLTNLGVRGAGGAISGGSQAALINEDDAAAGAAIGAILPTFVARPAKWALNRVLNGYQRLAGEFGQARANTIIRDALGVSYDDAVRALRNAPEGVTAEQALVDAGVSADAFMGVGAASRPGASEAFREIADAQAARRQGWLDRLAGGESRTAAQLAQRAEKGALRADTVPLQQAELAAADASGALDVAPISAALMQQADAPGVGTTNGRVMAEIASALDAMAARRGGVASAEDLYAFRRDDLDDIITRALSAGRGGEITSQAARRGELVRTTQQMLDDAIESAGGGGWRQYLDTYSSGSRGIERQAMMGVAGGLHRDARGRFVSLARGNNPDAVEGVFGTGRIDLANLMNPTGVGPSGMNAMTRAASEIERDALVDTMATAGAPRARELLNRDANLLARRAMNRTALRMPVASAVVALSTMMADAKVAQQTRVALTRAYQSGANMDELLAMVPLAERAQVARNLADPALWSHLTGVGANAMVNPDDVVISQAVDEQGNPLPRRR